MIQRIQTVYLLLALLFIILMFFLPVAKITVDHEIYSYYTTKVVKALETPEFYAWNKLSLILNIFVLVMGTIPIFLYKKRFLQLRLCIVNMVLLLGLFVLTWLQIHSITNTFTETMNLEASYRLSIAFIFPFISIILTWLATRGIIKDIVLLKSYDRIR